MSRRRFVDAMLRVVLLLAFVQTACGLHDAKRLYEDLLWRYYKFVRPVHNASVAADIQFKLKIIQIADVVRYIKPLYVHLARFQHEKDQIVTINGWLVHVSLCRKALSLRLWRRSGMIID